MALLFAVGLTACEWFQGAPESRARDFIETLVIAPDNLELLRALANVNKSFPPEELVDDVAGKVAIEYLRAKLRQGVRLDFTFTNAKRRGKRYWIVPVIVNLSGRESELLRSITFNVELEKNHEAGWRIRRARAGD